MKISIARIRQIINEERKKLPIGETEISLDTEDAEDAEDLGPEARAEPAEQTGIILGDLKKILEHWEEAEYESDESRWQEYAKDIQNMIDQHEGEEAPAEHTEEECEEVHPEQTHEEWEAEQEAPREEGEEGEAPKKKSKKKEGGPSSGSKPSAPKLAKMTYESKKKRLNNELVKMIKEELTKLKEGVSIDRWVSEVGRTPTKKQCKLTRAMIEAMQPGDDGYSKLQGILNKDACKPKGGK
jgi:hypothetical protein